MPLASASLTSGSDAACAGCGGSHGRWKSSMLGSLLLRRRSQGSSSPASPPSDILWLVNGRGGLRCGRDLGCCDRQEPSGSFCNNCTVRWCRLKSRLSPWGSNVDFTVKIRRTKDTLSCSMPRLVLLLSGSLSDPCRSPRSSDVADDGAVEPPSTEPSDCVCGGGARGSANAPPLEMLVRRSTIFRFSRPISARRWSSQKRRVFAWARTLRGLTQLGVPWSTRPLMLRRAVWCFCCW
mmetsp:Transcript_110317/g.312158  ORF Transcript_110317/g.312158 Transcript_110317/m.312158 type:complete len:237 (-) Transcript_110317:211-921(-)